MDVNERIQSQLSAAPVVLFMKGTPDFPQCGFSAQAVSALRACGARFHAVNIFEDPELREALKRMGRADLIGSGKRHLIPAWQPKGTGESRPRATPGGRMLTQHTGLPPRGRLRGKDRK